MALSKDQLAFFDPAIKRVNVVNNHISLTLEQNTVILTFSEQELYWLTKHLQEIKNGVQPQQIA